MSVSKSAVDRLGERLRDGTATEADWTLLEELRAERQRQLTDVVMMLRAQLGLEVTSRVKTTNTLVEKLQRERMRLSQMDDVAGARIKIDGTRREQDQVVDLLLATWPGARVKDRRVQPVHGYRAVHVIPVVGGWPLEVQVRTAFQDAVANMLERLADTWGRQIRYGEPPADPDTLVVPMLKIRRSGILAVTTGMADAVAQFEESPQDDALGDALELALRLVAAIVEATTQR